MLVNPRRDILHVLRQPILLELGYGSGFFTQNSTKPSMRDYLIVVENAQEFHLENFRQNPSHYSLWTKYILEKPHRNMVDFIQNSGAGIWYNSGLVDHRLEGKFKYGIVQYETFIDDLLNWKSLYLAGRLHKPVELHYPEDYIYNAKTRKILESIEINRVQAFLVALLLSISSSIISSDALRNKPIIMIDEILYSIISLSYLGDFRMTIGENPKKISNILSGQYADILKCYKSSLEFGMKNQLFLWNDSNLLINADLYNFELLSKHPIIWSHLPKEFSSSVLNSKNFEQLYSLIIGKIKKISKLACLKQSIKGLITANPSVVCNYTVSKLKKMF